MFKQDVILVKTGNSAATMRKAVPKLVGLIKKMAAGEEILGPSIEGYLERGIRVNYFAEERGISGKGSGGYESSQDCSGYLWRNCASWQSGSY